MPFVFIRGFTCTQLYIVATYRQSLEASCSMEVASSVPGEFLMLAFSPGCSGLFPPIPDSVGDEGDHLLVGCQNANSATGAQSLD